MLKSHLIALDRTSSCFSCYIYIKRKNLEKNENSVGRGRVWMEKKHLILKVRMSGKLTLTNRLIERWPANPRKKENNELRHNQPCARFNEGPCLSWKDDFSSNDPTSPLKLQFLLELHPSMNSRYQQGIFLRVK